MTLDEFMALTKADRDAALGYVTLGMLAEAAGWNFCSICRHAKSPTKDAYIRRTREGWTFYCADCVGKMREEKR